MNKHIKEALINGRLALLLGAGASSGCRNRLDEELPLGGDLAKILANEMGEEYEGESLKSVYAAAKSVMGDQVNGVLERHYKHCKPSNDYAELIKYPFRRIYSLNIDDAIENVPKSSGEFILNVRRRFDAVVEVDQLFKEIDYIKINGDILHPRDGFVFSDQDYGIGSAQVPVWYRELARDYFKYTFLFIGTKIQEPLFYHQVEKYKIESASSVLKSYVLVPSMSSIDKKMLASSNIEYIDGSLSDFINWLSSEFPSPPSSRDMMINVRPELKLAFGENKGNLSVFSNVTPVARSSLALIDEGSSNSGVRGFYKGFKPTWRDILDGVPANLKKVRSFYDGCLSGERANPQDLYVLFGAAGCGKSTALKQIALDLCDEGNRSVYFLEEYKEDLESLIKYLDERHEKPYFVFFERVGDIAYQLSDALKGGLTKKAIFVTAENQRIWKERVAEHLHEFLTDSVDISRIDDSDADSILRKLQKYGNWTRLSNMSEKNRKIEILKKSKRQLLIGLLEATSGEGYNKIIKRDYEKIESPQERYLLIMSGLATMRRVPANEATLVRALSYLGVHASVKELASHMEGVLTYSNGSVMARHRVYIEHLFRLYVSQEELMAAISSYIKSFSVYKFPIIRNVSKNEASIYKNLVNAKSLKKLLKNNKDRVVSIYEAFEKDLEHEGLFLMQYGLALRSFGDNQGAFEKLKVAQQAFPESSHIEHALAQQRIILACQEDSESIALDHFSEAESVLNRLNSGNVRVYDHYPIITLSEGHVKLMDHLGNKKEARILAKKYHDQIKMGMRGSGNNRLSLAIENLTKYYVSGEWPAMTNGDFEDEIGN